MHVRARQLLINEQGKTIDLQDNKAFDSAASVFAAGSPSEVVRRFFAKGSEIVIQESQSTE